MLYERTRYNRAAEAESRINRARIEEMDPAELRTIRATAFYRREVAWWLDELASVRKVKAPRPAFLVETVPYALQRLAEARATWEWYSAGCPNLQSR